MLGDVFVVVVFFKQKILSQPYKNNKNGKMCFLGKQHCYCGLGIVHN